MSVRMRTGEGYVRMREGYVRVHMRMGEGYVKVRAPRKTTGPQPLHQCIPPGKKLHRCKHVITRAITTVEPVLNGHP